MASTMDAKVNEKGPTSYADVANPSIPTGGVGNKQATITTTTTSQPQNVQSSQFSQQGNQTQRKESQINLFWRKAKEGFQDVKHRVENYSSNVPMSNYAIPLLLLAVFLALWANGSMQGLKDKLVPSSTTSSIFTKTEQAPPQQVCFPVPNTDNVKNMMPDSNTVKNMMPNSKDYMPDSNTVKNMMPDSNTVKNMMPNSKDYIPDGSTVKNMMPDSNTVKNMMPNTDSVKETVNQYIPDSNSVKDTVKEYIPNAETFKNVMPGSQQPDTRTQQIKTEIVQEFQVPNQQIQQPKVTQESKSFETNQGSLSEKLSQAGEAIKSGYEKVKEKVAGSSGSSE